MTDPVVREVFLAFWKVHILHHARGRPIYGQWMLEELERHGFSLSPGTLYPLLARMEQHGWLKGQRDPAASIKARREYVLTKEGARALARIRRQLGELYREVVLEKGGNAS
jgi:DNA-binding PadR family transcriptional regulator